MKDDLEPLDPQLRSYLRSRADLLLPPDLAVRAFERVRAAGPRSTMGFGRWATLAGIAAVLVIAAISFTLGSRPQVRPTFSPHHSQAAVASTDKQASAEPTVVPSPEIGGDGFPASVLGMPVVSVADTHALLDEGRLDGRAVAVKGYWIQVMVPSCPAPNRYMAPLEQWCFRPVFSSVGYVGRTCTDFIDGHGECHSNSAPPGAATLTPVMLGDTAGHRAVWVLPEQYPDGYPAVLIGHANDPRAWQCPADTRDQCRREFVVDRVAWFAGHDVALGVPEVEIRLSSGLEDIASSIGAESLLTAWAGVAWNAPEVDPRFHAAWSEIIWIARTVGEGMSPTDPTRALDVWFVDDDSATIIESMSLEASVDYMPGTFRAQAVIRSAPDDAAVYFLVDTLDGIPVQDVGSSGWQTSDGSNRRLLLPGLAAVLDPGTYVVRASQKNFHIPSTKHPDQCSTEFELGPLEDLRLEAVFPADGACEWRAPTFEDGRF